MAVLASQDWHPPRDLQMDAPSNAINSAVPRQRSSPANDPGSGSSPVGQQPYPYPVQQQQAGWTPSHPQQQYYPSFYQNHHQQPFQIHGHPAQGQIHPQNPYYDPANAQLAQWAYQQMMFNAHQAHQMSHVPSPHPGQRSRTGSASTGEYFVSSQVPSYSPFPSGTPPAHPSQLPNGYSPGGDHPTHQNQYNGFHPYRRPNRQGSHNPESPQQSSPTGDWRGGSPAGPFQPPYARADAAGSSTSVNSAGSNSGSTRQRTNSTQGSTTTSSTPGKPPATNGHGRGTSNNSSSSTTSSPSNTPRPHQRTTSSSSTSSSATAPRPVATTSVSAPAVPHGVNLRKPSPLSQGTYTAAEKRMSRDDSDLTAMLEPAPGVRSGGLKGRLRRALSLNAGATLREEEEEAPVKSSSSRRDPTSNAAGSTNTVTGDDESTSTATVQKKKSRSLFNSRLNRSTDNISLSSTMSSASMVIRKLGNLGKLGRRNSLAGITSLFKDKKDKEGEEVDKKGKKKKDGKGQVSEPSVSHATAELDPGEWSQDMNGLSPAARLARQHTLRTNAEAAAKAKAEQEARAAAAQQGAGDPNLPATWEKNTTNRQGETTPGKGSTRINEDGMRVVVEDDDSDSDDGQGDHIGYNHGFEGWEEDDDDWGETHEEDVTIRQGLESAHLDDVEMEPWAMGVRRSVERTRRPTKGILKNGSGYDQDTFQRPNPSFTRNRANSYDSPASQGPELGPLARMPSPDPDHIDGLHRHPHPPSGSSSFIPPLTFDSKGLSDSPKDASPETSIARSATPERALFNHPNSSAPALSTMFTASPPTLTHRSATSPAKRLAFASNLSVYDTFPATVYDRRSEPATWSRLTPALAQRIKEELNSYKMEEMEVHASSRVHTQFFV
ncbi:hypothetical protein PHLCEN_2v12975 [Hermanssonia centrifuga]|uniref:Uncharacterized protein n=1 Tax=Hermanssonia centrifuga TaxID=98765 RepID=A0A2R6NFS3_9APHY|nr:hypothetical protein PHLCEN_2v12975 [Hermanssonia centrifuga]